MIVEVGSFWLIKDSDCVAIVKSIIAKANGGLTVVYAVTNSEGMSSYRMSCEYELFTNIAEKLITKSELKVELNKEYVKGKTDGYSEGYQHGFDLGYSKAIEEIKSSNTGIGHLLGEELDKGYNEAIKEMSESEELGETTEYVFGTEDCCEHHSPNKETQEAMQEVLDNPFIIKPSDLFKRKYFKEDDKHKYPHYFKDVSDLKWLDVYQVCKLFPVEDDSGAISHARKKLLVCGGRGGGKDKIKDIKEARDTLNRYLEIEGEQDD